MLAERYECKGRCKALMTENHCLPGLAKQAKKLRAKVLDIENTNVLEKLSLLKESGNIRPATSKKRVTALEAELKKARDA